MEEDYFEKDFIFSKRMSGHDNTINDLKFSPSGHFLCSVGTDLQIMLTNVFSENFSTKEFVFSPHTEEITSIVFKNELILYSASMDSSFCSYDLERSCCNIRCFAQTPCTKIDYSFNFSKDVVGISTTDNIKFFDERSNIFPVLNLDIPNSKLEFRPGSSWNFLLGSFRNKMMLYDFRNTKIPILRYKLEKNIHGISDCVFNKKGDLILVTGHSKLPVIYRVDNPRKKVQFCCDNFSNVVTFKTYTFGGPNDDYILSGSDNKTVVYWKLSPGDIFETSCYDLSKNTLCNHELKEIHNMKFKKLKGFSSIMNRCLMHEKVPLIFCSGIENSINIFSTFPIGHDDDVELNYDMINFTNSLAEEISLVYRQT